jgi:modulator of FtsH protease HflK
MAWNEPGGGGKDPWRGRNGDQGPPDLDEIVRKMQDKFGSLFGGGKKGGGGSGSSVGKPSPFAIGLIAAIALVVWLLSGIYIVNPAERGVVLRFGEYTRTTMPGPHWRIPWPIEQVQKVDVDQIRAVPHRALMLTQDENIVVVDLAVQYLVKDARDYLFNVRNPDTTLREVAESAIREIVGKSSLDFVLTEGRAEVAASALEVMQANLDQYVSGLQITTVNLQDAQPPDEVQNAFEDAIRAREDEQRLKNEAEAYANEIIPRARGAAARQLEEAAAYRDSVIAQAEGESARFVALLTEYQRAPDVTRERLYLETMEHILANSSKVLVDVKGGNNLMYLPLDRLIQQQPGGRPEAGALETFNDTTPVGQLGAARDRENMRRREVR